MEKNSFLENLYKNAGYYCVALISFIYIASSLILISKTGKSVYEIIGTGFLSLVVGSLINSSLRSVGLRRGENDDRLTEALSKHALAVEKIASKIDLLDGFCEKENKAAIKRIRMKLLAAAGLKYDDCFDENGVCKELDFSLMGGACSSREGSSFSSKMEQKRKINRMKKSYSKAVKLKIKELTPSALLSDGGGNASPFDFGKSKSGYNKSRGVSDIAARIVMALIFGYFGVSLVSEINFAALIWNSLQIVMYIASGAIGMYSTYMWIVGDYRQGILRKIEYLNRFLACTSDK